MKSQSKTSIFKKATSSQIQKAFQTMLQEHGEQGWWPVSCEVGDEGYHPSDFETPKTRQGRFEICIGAILTQNTAWTNVQKALVALKNSGLINPESLARERLEVLQQIIKPAGYFVQKSRYLQNIAKWFMENDQELLDHSNANSRSILLGVKGVGPETADSILLYAYKIPTFVVDVYTKRIFSSFGILDASWSYGQIQELFHASLPRDHILFQEFHAVIVAHAKKYFRKSAG